MQESETGGTGGPDLAADLDAQSAGAFGGNHLSGITCLTHVVLQTWRIVWQITVILGTADLDAQSAGAAG